MLLYSLLRLYSNFGNDSVFKVDLIRGILVFIYPKLLFKGFIPFFKLV